MGHELGSCSGQRIDASQTSMTSESERYLKASAMNSDPYLTDFEQMSASMAEQREGGRRGAVQG
jgi:hypothetical protein